MNKMLVAVFDSENKAFEGLSALKELHESGDISLYATAVVTKNETGVVNLKTAADGGPIGTATGLFTGSLIGLLGGPVGVAIGAATGTLAGLIFDVNTDDVNTTFVEDVSEALVPGKTAVIAEVDETWSTPVDSRLDGLNAMVFRRLRYEVEDDQFARESEAIEAEFRQLQEELKEAREEDKAAIRQSIEKLQNKAKAVNDLVKKKMDKARYEFEAKVDAMQKQVKTANDRRKAKIEKRIKEVKEEYNARNEKLRKASKLINEALAPSPLKEAELA